MTNTDLNALNIPSAKVILDSISPTGYRLTTIEVKMHRFVLAEYNTHRLHSRNSASSRAIPIKKRIADVKNNLAWPVWWGRNQKGMQAAEELTGWRKELAFLIWEDAARQMRWRAWLLEKIGLHKQITNRVLEPFLWHTAIVSATEWNNFWWKRCHKDAQPEMRAAAEAMKRAYDESTPQKLDYGQWHLPYISAFDWSELGSAGDAVLAAMKRISVARCARVSYLTHDGRRSVEEDLQLYGRLAKTGGSSTDPPHDSPFEHVATPGKGTGNFKGWNQFRHYVFPDDQWGRPPEEKEKEII